MLFRPSTIAICVALLTAILPGPAALAEAGPRAAPCTAALHAAACEREDRVQKPRKRSAGAAPTQKALLKAQIDRLPPQRPGVTDLYTIGVAGWAGEDVFIRELEGALTSFGKVLPTDGRVVRLVNRKETLRTIPLATRNNLAAAVRAVADVMDTDEDVLVLFMTSHGNRTGFGLQLPGREPTELPARAVARMFANAGIRHRVVIVSACYSGIFVKPLANDNSIVLTAADANNVSFGCAPGREWTYFGDALFSRALRPGVDLQQAYNAARLLISEWELKERFPPSNPQGHFGEAMMQKLAPLYLPVEKRN